MISYFQETEKEKKYYKHIVLKWQEFGTTLPKLSNEEKKTLIKFYKENPVLWNSNDPYYKNKMQRSLVKTRLTTLFEDKYLKMY